MWRYQLSNDACVYEKLLKISIQYFLFLGEDTIAKGHYYLSMINYVESAN